MALFSAIRYFILSYLAAHKRASVTEISNAHSEATGYESSYQSFFTNARAMKDEGLLKAEKEGRTMNYSLTGAGRKALKTEKKYLAAIHS